jgi:mono/diheme cytochrome c family protein
MRLAKILTAALAALAATLSAACGPSQPAGNAAQGGGDRTRELYARNCAVCHGPQGEGKQMGTLQVPTLRAGRAAEDPDSRLFSQIHDGGNGMPPFRYTLNDDEIQDLLRFVREELQGKAQSR